MSSVTVWADRDNVATIAKWWKWTQDRWLATGSKDPALYANERDSIALDLHAVFKAAREGAAQGALAASVRPLVNPIAIADQIVAENIAAHARGEHRAFRESDPARETEWALKRDERARARAEEARP